MNLKPYDYQEVKLFNDCSFVRSLLRAEAQPTLDPSAETIEWSSVLAQGEKGIRRCVRCVSYVRGRVPESKK